MKFFMVAASAFEQKFNESQLDSDVHMIETFNNLACAIWKSFISDL